MTSGPAEPTPAVEVRAMTEADLDDALAMFRAVAGEGRWVGTEAGIDWTARREAMRVGLDAPARRSLVVVAPGGTIVGTGSVDVAGYGVAQLGMALATGWRGRGIGTVLLDELVAAARDLGAHKVALEVWPHNARALALYRSRGFVEEGRLVRHYRRADGQLWDAVVMGLALDEASPGSPYADGAEVG
ncbi:MAG: N-acetyltransferase [Acidimicrobiales bacterium]